MKFVPTDIEEVCLILPSRIGDQRGYFSETFRADLFRQAAGPFEFVQENRSMSTAAGTIRGLHFQTEPRAQGKLVQCLSGAVLDVAVDLRRDSPTYGKHVKAELSEDNGQQLWIPPGFAHGFCTLAASTVISYKVTDYYSAEHDAGIKWNDPALGIDWPVAPDAAILSEKDQNQPLLASLDVGSDPIFQTANNLV